MTNWAMIGVFNRVLAASGMITIRGFPTIFGYFFSMRLIRDNPNWTFFPESFRHLAENTHSFWVSSGFLTVVGILAILELAAVRYPDFKEILVQYVDRYAKPIESGIIVLGMVPAAEVQEFQKVIDGAAQMQAASFGGFTVLMMILAGWVTWNLCRIRAEVLETIQEIDPENDLKLQSLSNYLGEIAVAAVFFALIFLPLLALILTVIGGLTGLLFQRLWAKHERNHSHSCAACAAAGKETIVSDCALICPECGTEQPDIRRVGWFGFSGSRPLDGMSPEQHACRLLSAHRCRWCASPLDRSHACPRCGREQWTDELCAFYLGQTDRRCGLLLLLAAFGFVFGLLALILFRPLVVRPLSVHLSEGDRFMVAFVMMFLKLLILILYVLVSLIPVVGALPLLGRYLLVRSKFLRSLERTKAGRHSALEHGITAP